MSMLFVDDTFLFCIGTDLKDMIRQINKEMPKIYARINGNKLSFNIDKTTLLLFMTPKDCFIVLIIFYKPI